MPLNYEQRLLLVAGPCLIESWEVCARVAEEACKVAAAHTLKYVFKGSYRKANRTSAHSTRGIGDDAALAILERVRTEFHVAVTTDVHETGEIPAAAQVCELLQIPAFLCRQTALVEAAAQSGRSINIKKGQFMAPEDMGPVADKARSAGATEIFLTERGTSFGYRDLVVDFRGLQTMRGFGHPVLFDVTHAVQRPGAERGTSGGNREFIPMLLRAGLAAGIDGIFMEVHPDPANAASDRLTQWPVQQLASLFIDLGQRGLLA